MLTGVTVLLAAIVSVVSAAGCGRTDNPAKDGQAYSSDGQWPWMVFVGKKSLPWCSGVLVGDKWVLISKRCAKIGKLSDYSVMVGITKLDIEKPSTVSKIHMKPDADIALLELSKAVEAEQICNEASVDTSKCFTAGWGTSLQLIDFRKLQHDSGKSTEKCSKGKICFDMKCAAPLDGPLMCKQKDGQFYLGGFSTDGGAGCHSPHHFSDVHDYLEWVTTVMYENQ